MICQATFPKQLPLPSNSLSLTLISLEDWVLINVNGLDNIKYLQGQLTCDLYSLDYDHFKFAAHCNVTGKVLSFLYVFYYQKSIAFIQRRSICDKQLIELKKYAKFFKITISVNDKVILLGVAGFQAELALNQIFPKIPDTKCSIVHYQNITLLFFNLPTPRFLIITIPEMFNLLKYKLQNQIKFNNSQQWLALDIEAGYPIIDNNSYLQFIPQSINIHALGGISFNKGCYIGQEIIAKAKYRNTNKRTLYWLKGNANYNLFNNVYLEIKIGNNWRQTGSILALCQLINNNIWIQAVLGDHLKPNSLLRLCNDNSEALILNLFSYIVDKH